MRLWPVVGLIVALTVGITVGWWLLAVGAFCAYVIWTFVRIPLEKRARRRMLPGFEWEE